MGFIYLPESRDVIDITTIECIQRWTTKYFPSLNKLMMKDYTRWNSLCYDTGRLRGGMIETYKLITEKYDHAIVDFMPKPHNSSSKFTYSRPLPEAFQTKSTEPA